MNRALECLSLVYIRKQKAREYTPVIDTLGGQCEHKILLESWSQKYLPILKRKRLGFL